MIALTRGPDLEASLEEYQHWVQSSFAAAFAELRKNHRPTIDRTCNIQHAFLRLANHPELARRLGNSTFARYSDKSRLQFMLLDGITGKYELISGGFPSILHILRNRA